MGNEIKPIVECISRNTFFQHHHRLEVGKRYKSRISGYRDGVDIYDIETDVFIGSYWRYQFISLRESNLNKILEK